MNQTCRVCGEPAAGFHFGAFTCEGCKSFYGRSFNNIHAISPCKNNGECVINKKNRTNCKACRLQKCTMVGMSKTGSRYGRRSNWFKIHCLLQEQNEQGQGSLGSENNPSSDPYQDMMLAQNLQQQQQSSELMMSMFGHRGGAGFGMVDDDFSKSIKTMLTPPTSSPTGSRGSTDSVDRRHHGKLAAWPKTADSIINNNSANIHNNSNNNSNQIPSKMNKDYQLAAALGLPAPFPFPSLAQILFPACNPILAQYYYQELMLKANEAGADLPQLQQQSHTNHPSINHLYQSQAMPRTPLPLNRGGLVDTKQFSMESLLMQDTLSAVRSCSSSKPPSEPPLLKRQEQEDENELADCEKENISEPATESQRQAIVETPLESEGTALTKDEPLDLSVSKADCGSNAVCEETVSLACPSEPLLPNGSEIEDNNRVYCPSPKRRRPETKAEHKEENNKIGADDNGDVVVTGVAVIGDNGAVGTKLGDNKVDAQKQSSYRDYIKKLERGHKRYTMKIKNNEIYSC